MRLALPSFLALALLLLLAPAAGACSLVDLRFQKASWDEEGDLRYVAIDGLRRVQGQAETALAGGYFVSYADAGDGLLVGGQRGLGADCTGDGWLRLLEGGSGAVAWEQSGHDRPPAVFAHADGPFVSLDKKWWRWAGGELHPTDWTLPRGATHVIGVTADGRPVARADDRLVVGGHTIPSPASEGVAVAHNATTTAVLAVSDTGARLLRIAPDGTVAETRWTSGHSWPGLAWAEGTGWVALAGERAYLVAGLVTDLGVGDAVAVGARGAQPVAFDRGGYTVFAGAFAAERWTRAEDGTWSAGVPRATPATVSSSTAEGTATPVPLKEDRHSILVPAPAFAALAAAVLALAAAGRRRRRGPFEP